MWTFIPYYEKLRGHCPCGLWPHLVLLTLLIPNPAALVAQQWLFLVFLKVNKDPFEHQMQWCCWIIEFCSYLTLYWADFFELLKGRVVFWPTSEKLHIYSCIIHPNYLKLGTTHLWTSTKILTLSTWWKWWRHHCFWWWSFNNKFFCLTLKFFLCLKSTVFFVFF